MRSTTRSTPSRTQELSLTQAGDSGDCGHHHAGKELHSSHIALVEGTGGRGQYLENAQGAAVVTEGRDENRADSEAAATGEVHPRIALGIVTQHDFAGAYSFRRDASVGLQTSPEVRSSSAGTGAADNFVPGSQSDGRSGRAGQMLG